MPWVAQPLPQYCFTIAKKASRSGRHSGPRRRSLGAASKLEKHAESTIVSWIGHRGPQLGLRIRPSIAAMALAEDAAPLRVSLGLIARRISTPGRQFGRERSENSVAEQWGRRVNCMIAIWAIRIGICGVQTRRRTVAARWVVDAH